MEKEIILSAIQGKFKKDYDTFGNMDPQLQFRIGKSQGKTEVADGAGKAPKWKETVKLSFYDNEKTIHVKGLEIDTTSNDDLGDGKIDVTTLKQSGSIEFKLSLKGQQTGTITCKYVLKTLPPTPLLIIKNIKADFFRETKFLIKTKPYFSIGINGSKTVSQTKKEGNSKLLEWKETLYRKIKDTDLIQFNVEDADDKNSKMFGYSARAKQFRTLKGQKKFNVIGKNYEPLGVLTFDYETKNFVEKEESNKNQQAAKKEENSLTLINIKKAQGKFNFDGEDIYFKFNLGPNFFKTTHMENAKKDFTTDINKSLYAQYKQNKIVVGVYAKSTHQQSIQSIKKIEALCVVSLQLQNGLQIQIIKQRILVHLRRQDQQKFIHFYKEITDYYSEHRRGFQPFRIRPYLLPTTWKCFP